MRLILIFLLITNICLSQNEFNNWYFGNFAGVTFNSGNPVALIDGALSTTEGCASISDSNGNLLFYTNGIDVWNSTHNIMVNGTGLNGNNSSSQSAIIVQKPLSNDIYYIFTADADLGADGIQYSEVDMNMYGGLGAVTSNKNVLLHTPSCEKLTAVRHCNNQDIWVVSHDWNSSNYRAWLVTSTGVNTTSIISGTGPVIDGISQSSYGQMKASLQGDKLLASYYGFSVGGGNKVVVCNFNNSTGTVSNGITLSNDIGLYACEFSPDGRVAYAATNQGRLFQFNLCAGSNAAIQSSKITLGVLGAFIGSLQLGPDEKIYFSRNSSFLSVINNPNIVGTGCDVVLNSISLLGRNSSFGLPNFASYYLRPEENFLVSTNCLEVSLTAPEVFSGTCNQTSSILSYQWDFGDSNTSTTQNPTHSYASPGNYTITLQLNYSCYTSILTQSVNLAGIIPLVTTTITQP